LVTFEEMMPSLRAMGAALPSHLFRAILAT
jgi:hypothetical protein